MHELVSITVLTIRNQRTHKLNRLQPLEEKSEQIKRFSLFPPQRRYVKFFGCLIKFLKQYIWKKTFELRVAIGLGLKMVYIRTRRQKIKPGRHRRRWLCVFGKLVGGFTLGDLLDKAWSQVGVIPSPPRYMPFIFVAHRALSFPTARRFSSNAANSRSRAFR